MTDQDKLARDIEDIKNQLNSITRNIIRIERVLAHDTYIPTRIRIIEYSHSKRQLILDRRYVLKFEKNEADLMGLLFFASGKRKGLPKTTEISLAKIAKDNEILNLKPATQKAVYSAYKRINDRILDKTRIEFFGLSFNAVQFNEFANRNIEI